MPCMTVDAFNTWMATHAPATDVTLAFDVTGVNPNAFFGGKGALADFTHRACTEGGSLVIKVYGPDDPPNTAHPGGTLKQEYGYNCGPAPYGETWASPNPSDVVFVDGTERCDVTMWIDPVTFGYRLACDHGTFEAVGDNTPAMPVDWITLFALTNPDTWHIDAAISTWNEVCFESPDGDDAPPDEPVDDPDPDPDQVRTTEFLAIEDATVAVDHLTTVYPDVADLCVEAGYCESHLLFDLSAISGTVVSATLELASTTNASGSGADVYAAEARRWSDDTLTWDVRPAVFGQPLDRVGPIAPTAPYALDVTPAVTAGGLVGLALRPAASDTDGAHFQSTEVTGGPRLVVQWLPGEPEDSGTPEETPGPTDEEDVADDVPPAYPYATGCACDGAGSSPSGALLLALALGSRRRRPDVRRT